MSDTVIRVENLGKLYRISALQRRHDTLRDQLTAASLSLFHRFKRNPQPALSRAEGSEIRNPKSSGP